MKGTINNTTIFSFYTCRDQFQIQAMGCCTSSCELSISFCKQLSVLMISMSSQALDFSKVVNLCHLGIANTLSRQYRDLRYRRRLWVYMEPPSATSSFSYNRQCHPLRVLSPDKRLWHTAWKSGENLRTASVCNTFTGGNEWKACQGTGLGVI